MIISDASIFFYLYCALFYCPLYRTQPSLLLALLFHPFQFLIGQFVNNLWSLPTYCCTPPTALLSHESPEQACQGKLPSGIIVPFLFDHLFLTLDLRWKPFFSEQFQIKPNSTNSNAITVASTMSNSKSSFPDLELPWWGGGNVRLTTDAASSLELDEERFGAKSKTH